MPETRVLLTNDDGHAAEGLQALRASLLEDGLDVTVIAPSGNRSGLGRAVTCHAPVQVERVGGSDEHPVYSCTGTPVDCVRIGLFAREFDAADVVVSGINHGVNLGDDATYSGTLGAALEGALLGRPAVAFSQQDVARDLSMLSGAPHVFELAWLAPAIVRAAARQPRGERLAANVNFPNVIRDLSVPVTRLGSLDYDGRWMKADASDPTGSTFWPYMRSLNAHPAHDAAPDTDMSNVAAGRISITPVSLDWAAAGPGTRAAEFAARLATAAQSGLTRNGHADLDTEAV
jgi:5'-nucleotidase